MFAYSSAWYAVTDGSWLESLLLVCLVMLWIAAEADSSTTTSGFSYLIFFTSFQFQFFSAEIAIDNKRFNDSGRPLADVQQNTAVLEVY